MRERRRQHKIERLTRMQRVKTAENIILMNVHYGIENTISPFLPNVNGFDFH